MCRHLCRPHKKTATGQSRFFLFPLLYFHFRAFLPLLFYPSTSQSGQLTPGSLTREWALESHLRTKDQVQVFFLLLFFLSFFSSLLFPLMFIYFLLASSYSSSTPLTEWTCDELKEQITKCNGSFSFSLFRFSMCDMKCLFLYVRSQRQSQLIAQFLVQT